MGNAMVQKQMPRQQHVKLVNPSAQQVPKSLQLAPSEGSLHAMVQKQIPRQQYAQQGNAPRNAKLPKPLQLPPSEQTQAQRAQQPKQPRPTEPKQRPARQQAVPQGSQHPGVESRNEKNAPPQKSQNPFALAPLDPFHPDSKGGGGGNPFAAQQPPTFQEISESFITQDGSVSTAPRSNTTSSFEDRMKNTDTKIYGKNDRNRPVSNAPDTSAPSEQNEFLKSSVREDGVNKWGYF